jgi:hypothetical protein
VEQKEAAMKTGSKRKYPNIQSPSTSARLLTIVFLTNVVSTQIAAIHSAEAQWAPRLARGQVYLRAVNPELDQRLTVLRRECQDLTPSSPDYNAICNSADAGEADVTKLGCKAVQDPRASLTYTWGCPKSAALALSRIAKPSPLSTPN